jgi:uncharacterized protein YkwD
MTPPRRRFLFTAIVLIGTLASATRGLAASTALPASTSPAGRAVTGAPSQQELVGRMLALLNQTRTDHHLHALRLNRPLSEDALRHSRRMVRRGHLFPTRDMAEIMAPYDATIWAEDLAKGRALGGIRDGWVASPSTRVHLLNPNYRLAAIGIVRAHARLWVTLYLHD